MSFSISVALESLYLCNLAPVPVSQHLTKGFLRAHPFCSITLGTLGGVLPETLTASILLLYRGFPSPSIL